MGYGGTGLATMESLSPKEISKAKAAKTLRILADALDNDGIHSGFLLIEFSREGLDCARHMVIDACASVDYCRGSHWEYGEWVEDSGND